MNVSFVDWNITAYSVQDLRRVLGVRDIVFICISTLVMLTNLVVMIAFITSYNLRERLANYFILNLSINDFATGFLNATYYGSYPFRFMYGPLFWLILSSTQSAVYTCSFVSMSLVSLDRYIYITSPLHYHLRVTAIRVKAAIILSWVIPIIIMMIIPNIVDLFYNVIEDPRHFNISTYVNIAGPIMVIITVSTMLFTSVRILFEARKQQRKINNQVMTTATQVQSFKPAVEIRRLINTGVLVLVYLAMWLPYVIIAAAAISRTMNYDMIDVAGGFIFLNSCINPLLYAMNSDFKKAYLKIFYFIIRSP
ncbi:histamine H2 receptor-like [Saccoglossus kowalevskii]|uniref:Histamine H2 receptor-like n=1 Tax=Saccoglossus kowalevskii TaxID=10224 RepID=A0ABM0MCF9_SACKO|nr:PREDICTED: histamine H2 receptor-like [Saccoglossus kowalevskii]